jgi:hypothetical protein
VTGEQVDGLSVALDIVDEARKWIHLWADGVNESGHFMSEEAAAAIGASEDRLQELVEALEK